MDRLAQGLYVMGFGMTLVFVTLGLIMLVMVLLDRVFREKPEGTTPDVEAIAVPETGIPGGEPTSTPAKLDEGTGISPQETRVESEIAAAIAVAIARARAQVTYSASYYPASLDNVEDERWDWLWDEGVDDYGTTRGSQYANV